MNPNITRQIATMAQRVAGILAECNYAQRRMTTLRTAPDAYLITPDRAPDNYAEFLFRTSGTLRREPDASHRARGQFIG
jgi:hypothetical protein